MKRFLKEQGEADSYEDLEIEFIKGRKAELFLYDENGDEKDKIALHSISTVEELHEVMINLGFKRSVPHDPLPEVRVADVIGAIQN